MLALVRGEWGKGWDAVCGDTNSGRNISLSLIYIDASFFSMTRCIYFPNPLFVSPQTIRYLLAVCEDTNSGKN